MAVDVKEYAAFTGITEGYAEEILNTDVEHAKWHMPSGLAKLEKSAELMADMNDEETPVDPEVDPVDPTGDAGAGEGEDSGDGADLDAGDDLNASTEGVGETDPDGGSVEGEE